MLYRAVSPFLFFFLLSLASYAQQGTEGNYTSSATRPVLLEEGNTGIDSSKGVLNLRECLRYALKNQPALNQSYIDQSVATQNNRLALSGWLPQLSGSASLAHYFQSPISVYPVNGILTPYYEGSFDYSIPTFSATQTIFSPDVLLAVKAAKLNKYYAQQNTEGVKIELVSDVSKAFYNLLLSIQQVSVYRQDTARLKKNQSDAYNQYLSGVADKVDYKQATISLNNSLTQLKTESEAIQAKYALLKQFMGYPSDKPFTVKFDTTQMMQDIYIDTLEMLQFEKRIEYQELQTAKRIARETTMYYQEDFLPTLSAFYNYDQEYEAPHFSDLYNKAFPYSLLGVQLNIPIFTGFKRTDNVRKAKLEEKRMDWDEVNLKLSIYSEYRQAIANYKSNFYNLQEQHENMQTAQEVYDIVKLQYREGIKPYLDVIVAESDLQTSEINYLNALFQLLESKIDLEKALGDIPTEI